jgi:hypothetical protein
MTSSNLQIPKNVSYHSPSAPEGSEDGNDGSVPPLTTRNDSLDESGSEESSSGDVANISEESEVSDSDSDDGVPNLTQRDFQSSSSNDSRDTFG